MYTMSTASSRDRSGDRSRDGSGADRAPLDRGRVLAAAVAAADSGGLDSVSMRGLASELGVVPMALYKHVADKGDLVDGMVDAVVADYAADYADPRAEAGARSRGFDAADWRSAVRGRILAARRTLGAHPWLRSAIETRTRRTPAVLAHMDSVAGELIAAGLSIDLAHHAMHALGHRIWGFSPEAFDEPPAADAAPAPVPTPEEQEAMMREMVSRYPHVAAIAREAATRDPSGACDGDAEFEFTLDLLLDAIQRLHESGWQSRA